MLRRAVDRYDPTPRNEYHLRRPRVFRQECGRCPRTVADIGVVRVPVGVDVRGGLHSRPHGILVNFHEGPRGLKLDTNSYPYDRWCCLHVRHGVDIEP